MLWLADISPLSIAIALTRWRHKALRRSNAETHSAVENLRQEVGQSIRYSRQATEAHREPPDFKIQAGLQELDKIERLGGHISPVGINASDNKVHLASVEEIPGFLRAGVGEWHEKEVAHDSDADGQDAFDDKDPPPSAQPGQPVHLHQAESEDAAESRCDYAEQVEDGVALAHVVADVPS
jgi:hypothetical protein